MEEGTKVSFRRELDALTTLRDELKLKAHLAKADAKDELHRLEDKWERMEMDLKRSASHMKEPFDVIGQSTKDLVKELKQSYENLKHRLES